eukprot:CAMPEP_0116849600 /NCGR_PEP_ID=MMETSP0418-20121206/15668_1 /TAXON_ID=1158023 /ORGANISM="Astrosyne radiata, Strain 13vi08-1A" /LENGTH=164 /DNA_ID=CAMNT_0004481351 /DNA_START=34 /DNA_END=528 /DNA_ORIENTATION=-
MPPKADAGEVKYIIMKCTGGDPAPPSVLAPKCGPLGISPKKVGDDIQAATKAWKGIKVVVKVAIQNRMASVEVTPTSSALIVKALGIVRDRKKEKNPSYAGTITMEQVLEVARTIRDKSQARTFAGTVKEVLGTCFSIGCNINGEHPRDVQAKIDSGEITVGDA